MSGGAAPPVVVPASAPPVLTRIGAPVAPMAVYSQTPGVPGPAGAQGIQGVPGTNTGFGQIVYTHVLAGAGQSIAANTRTQLTFAPDAILTTDYLNAPFKGHAFWDGTKLLGRQFADVLLVQVNLQVTPAVEGGSLLIDLDVGSTLGPVTSDSEILGANATVVQRISGKLVCQTNAGFMANGGKIYLTTTVPASIVRESLFVIPLSTYTGP